MLKELKKITFKKIGKIVLICGIIFILLFVPTIPCIVTLLNGTSDLYSIPIDKLPGAYVECDIGFIFDSFAEKAVTKNNSRIRSSRYYIIPIGDYEFMGISVNSTDVSLADKILKETYSWIEEGKPITHSLHIKGTVKEMNYKVAGYYEDWFIEAGFTDEEIDQYALKYVIEPNYLGYMNIYVFYTLIAISSSILFYSLLFAIITTLRVFIFIRNNANTGNLEEIDQDFQQAVNFGNVFIGRNYTVFIKGFMPNIVRNKDIIWAYHRHITARTNGIKTHISHVLNLNTRTKKSYSIGMKSESIVYEVIEYYKVHQPHIILGYSNELMNCYRRDFNTFLEMSHKQVADAISSNFDTTANNM